MTRYDFLSKSHHPASKGGSVPNFTQADLDAILYKKEKALKKYTACSQQWLVIVEAQDFFSYHDNIDITPGFTTEFDKVFMWRTWPSMVVILK